MRTPVLVNAHLIARTSSQRMHSSYVHTCVCLAGETAAAEPTAAVEPTSGAPATRAMLKVLGATGLTVLLGEYNMVEEAIKITKAWVC